MTQREQILDWLRQGHTLTPVEALHRFGVLALSQRCGDLRRRGYPIRSELIPVKSIRGVKYVARYSMVRA
jgi:hypothetical protein